MEKLLIKIKSTLKQDLKKTYLNPKNNAKPGLTTIYLKDSKQLCKIMSLKRIDILNILLTRQEMNLIDLSKETKTSQKALHRQLIQLIRVGLVKKFKINQIYYIKGIYSEIRIKVI